MVCGKCGKYCSAKVRKKMGRRGKVNEESLMQISLPFFFLLHWMWGENCARKKYGGGGNGSRKIGRKLGGCIFFHFYGGGKDGLLTSPNI